MTRSRSAEAQVIQTSWTSAISSGDQSFEPRQLESAGAPSHNCDVAQGPGGRPRGRRLLRRPRRARFLHQSPRQTRRRGPRRSQGAAPGARRAEGRWTRIARARRFRRPVPQRAAAAREPAGRRRRGFQRAPGAVSRDARRSAGGRMGGGIPAAARRARGLPVPRPSRLGRPAADDPPRRAGASRAHRRASLRGGGSVHRARVRLHPAAA